MSLQHSRRSKTNYIKRNGQTGKVGNNKERPNWVQFARFTC